MTEAKRVHIDISGAVQGVGFRPFVYGLASRLGLGGYVKNDVYGVEIELDGPGDALEAFLWEVRQSPPPLARITDFQTRDMPSTGEHIFLIELSRGEGRRKTLIAPDVATCADCLREMHDLDNRRYRYPFINCTNCGPRYTIIRDVPYDRANTTMAEFSMCARCQAEYENPANRRFHAEPTCCPDCGPHLELLDGSGAPIVTGDVLAESLDRLARGEILAVKGLGGFHLACDAANAEAVRLLRQRKQRDLKPFALLVRDLVAAQSICQVTEDAALLLGRPERPILLLNKRSDHELAEEVAPRSATFGVMMPYTPLHEMLMEGPFRALVMTSGNVSDEPIAFTNNDALARLTGLADAFLLHNRTIHIRTDDSVARSVAGRQRFLRRSRGYAPFPVMLPAGPTGIELLAVGAELSNTICVTRENQAFLSHHLGDLHNFAAYEAFLQAVDHLKSLLDVQPGMVVCDQHPNYASTQFANACGLPIMMVQHHHAHAASVLAEHQRTDKTIAVSFDGLGWGDDQSAWGGEFLICDLSGFERVGHLAVVPQPGADAAARRPARMGYVYLTTAFGERADALAEELLPMVSAEERRIVTRLVERNLQCPMTSSAGRLFDAAAALLGICSENTYHAQAPMELEACANEAPEETGHYPVRIECTPSAMLVVHAEDAIAAMVEDFRRNGNRNACAARFHNSIARMTLDVCGRIRNNSGLSTVTLSGGVMANAFLVERLVAWLEAEQFEVLLNERTPAGDGGVSLGQAAVAAWRLSCA